MIENSQNFNLAIFLQYPIIVYVIGGIDMKMDERCIPCIINNQDRKIQKECDHTKKINYMKHVLRIIGNSGNDETMPWISSQIDALFKETFPERGLDYASIKKHYNTMMVNMEDDLRKNILEQEDPLKYAIQLAIVGNYIDFGALQNVDTNFFMDLLEQAHQNPIDQKTYEQFKEDLKHAKKVMYICDNCGEVLLDKLCIEQIKRNYPHIQICAMVRGAEVINDASMVDATDIHLMDVCEVTTNGIALAGTDLVHICEESRKRIYEADVIISKGQANFETLSDNGLPIYFMLLCKCDLFAQRFGLEKYTGVLFYEQKRENV